MDFIGPFLAERWFIIVAAIVLLFIAIKIAKAVIKWGLVLAVLAALFFYGASYRDKVVDVGRSVSGKVATEVKTHAMHAIQDEMKDARYTGNADGSFTVTTKSVKLEGKPGAKEARITFGDQTFTMKLDDTLKALIEQAKKRTDV